VLNEPDANSNKEEGENKLKNNLFILNQK